MTIWVALIFVAPELLLVAWFATDLLRAMKRTPPNETIKTISNDSRTKMTAGAAFESNHKHARTPVTSRGRRQKE